MPATIFDHPASFRKPEMLEKLPIGTVGVTAPLEFAVVPIPDPVLDVAVANTVQHSAVILEVVFGDGRKVNAADLKEAGIELADLTRLVRANRAKIQQRYLPGTHNYNAEHGLLKCEVVEHGMVEVRFLFHSRGFVYPEV